MKLDITKSQNGGYIIKDCASKALNVVASATPEADKSAEEQQQRELGKVIVGLVDEWYEKGGDKVVTMTDQEPEENEPSDDDDGVLPNDFITALGHEFLKIARKVPSRHKPRKKKTEEGAG